MGETEIQKVVNKNRLSMSRVPSWAKEVFTQRAKEEFDDNYGLCLAAMLKECGEYNKLKQMFFGSELKIQLLLDNPQIPEENSEKVMNVGNGKTIKFGGKKEK